MASQTQERPFIKMRAVDKERGEIAKLEASIFTLPEQLGFDDTALIGVLDAIRRYYEQNPTLARLEIQVIADDA